MNSRIPAEASTKAGEPTPRRWSFAGFAFDLDRGELTGPAGPIALRPKADLLLREFLARPGHLLGRDELMQALWPATVVTDDSLVQAVGELRAALGRQGQQLIRTVPRRGYRFEGLPVELPPRAVHDAAAPVPPPAPPVEVPVAPTEVSSVSRRWHRRRPLVAAVAVGLVLAGVAVAVRWAGAPAPVRIDAEIAARHVFAVMPFAPASGASSPLHETAEMLAHHVATQLATWSGGLTIGNRKTAALANASLAELAEALGATYAIHGRVAPAVGPGRGASVDVQLVALPGGGVVGAKHFELGPGADAEAASDLGQQVLSFVRGRVSEIDTAAITRPGHRPTAAELAMLGWDEINQRGGPVVAARARARFEEALRADPGSIIALDGLGAVHLQQRTMGVALSASQSAAGDQAIELALRRAPNDPTAALLWASLQTMRGRPDLAIPAIEKSNRLVPGFTNGHLMLARALLSVGRSAEVGPEIERAARLATLMGDVTRASSAWSLGAEAALMRHDDATALSLARCAVAEYPNSREAHAVLAAAEALSGLQAEARAEMATHRRLAPQSTIASFDAMRPSSNPAYLSARARFYEGLRLAGLPER